MNRFSHILFVIISMFIMVLTPAFAQNSEENSKPEIIVYMNEYPPYIELLDNGSLRGPWVDKVTQFLNPTGIKYEIYAVPWGRAYKESIEKNNVLIAHLDRTENREDQFHWLLPISSLTYSLLAANKPELRNTTLEEVLKGDEDIACVKGSAPCQILRDVGFEDSRIVEFSDFAGMIITDLIIQNRTSLILDDYELITKRMTKEQLEKNDVILLCEVRTVTSYLAASKNIDPELLEKILAVVDQEE